ncbi:hypothetical protein Taro_022298, partial [Colocasia esculenta]|nr:hypothetical protein [Colocasia esculenta]
MHMGVDDGVFVPPSDVTYHGGYIDVRNGGVCATVEQHCLYARRLVTTEDLNENARSRMTTCGVFSRTRRRRARTRRTEHQRTPRTFSPAHAAYFFKLAHGQLFEQWCVWARKRVGLSASLCFLAPAACVAS